MVFAGKQKSRTEIATHARAHIKKRRKGAFFLPSQWRPGSESNRRTRLCRPLHDHSATWPLRRTATITGPVLLKKQNPGSPRFCLKTGAGNETRTRDPDLGKVVLYQLSYSRIGADNYSRTRWEVNTLLTPLRTVRASCRNHFRRRRRVRPSQPARHIVRCLTTAVRSGFAIKSWSHELISHEGRRAVLGIPFRHHCPDSAQTSSACPLNNNSVPAGQKNASHLLKMMRSMLTLYELSLYRQKA